MKTSKLNKLLANLNAEPVTYSTKVGKVKLIASSKKELLNKLIIYQIPSPSCYDATEKALPKAVIEVNNNLIVINYKIIDLEVFINHNDELEPIEEFRIDVDKQQFIYSPATLRLIHKQLKRVGWAVELPED